MSEVLPVAVRSTRVEEAVTARLLRVLLPEIASELAERSVAERVAKVEPPVMFKPEKLPTPPVEMLPLLLTLTYWKGVPV